MTAQTANVDVAFVGGGIAALWLACLAKRRGLSVAVVAPEPLGGEQTMASQGIIHGGGKYLLRRNLTRRFASDSLAHLATMPARWRRCLAGDIVEASGDIDLGSVPVLAERVELRASTRAALPRFRVATLWARASLEAETSVEAETSARARAPVEAGASLGARASCPRTRPKGAPPNAPQGESIGAQPSKAGADTARYKGSASMPEDFVVDAESLVRRLASNLQGRVLPGAVVPQAVLADADGIAGIRLPNTTLLAQRYVFAAGAGNAELAPRAGFDTQATVLRPLHQVWARVERTEPVFAHYLTRAFGTEPDLTVTTHQCDNTTVLYLGGHLATAGVDRSESAQTKAACHMLAAALPDIDIARAEFHPLRVDRAEPRRSVAQRPSDTFLTSRRNASLCFPIKLSLMPRLGDLFLDQLTALEPISNPWRGDPKQPIALARRPWA